LHLGTIVKTILKKYFVTKRYPKKQKKLPFVFKRLSLSLFLVFGDEPIFLQKEKLVLARVYKKEIS
jgi:hypothetical protein